MFSRPALRIALLALVRSPFAWPAGPARGTAAVERREPFRLLLRKAQPRPERTGAGALVERAFRRAGALVPDLPAPRRARSRLLTETTIASV